jgi:hypothetical protein
MRFKMPAIDQLRTSLLTPALNGFLTYWLFPSSTTSLSNPRARLEALFVGGLPPRLIGAAIEALSVSPPSSIATIIGMLDSSPPASSFFGGGSCLVDAQGLAASSSPGCPPSSCTRHSNFPSLSNNFISRSLTGLFALGRREARPVPGKTQPERVLTHCEHGICLSHFTFLRWHDMHDRVVVSRDAVCETLRIGSFGHGPELGARYSKSRYYLGTYLDFPWQVPT